MEPAKASLGTPQDGFLSQDFGSVGGEPGAKLLKAFGAAGYPLSEVPKPLDIRLREPPVALPAASRGELSKKHVHSEGGLG